MHVHATALAVPDDPRVRPARNLMRALAEASRLADARESGEKKSFVERLKAILSGRKLRAVFQPIVGVKTGEVLGYEALIRGPQDHELEMPDDLRAVAREGDLLLELESLCVETVFCPCRVARASALRERVLAPLTHSVFLDDRNLAEMTRARRRRPRALEKEVVFNYPAFGKSSRAARRGLRVRDRRRRLGLLRPRVHRPAAPRVREGGPHARLGATWTASSARSWVLAALAQRASTPS